MTIVQYEIWLANLDPRFGTEAGKTRPVVVIQTDLLNGIHPSTVVCPITTNVLRGATILRIHLKKGESGVVADCDIMLDQIRAIDNKRLLKRVGKLTSKKTDMLADNLRILLDL